MQNGVYLLFQCCQSNLDESWEGNNLLLLFLESCSSSCCDGGWESSASQTTLSADIAPRGYGSPYQIFTRHRHDMATGELHPDQHLSCVCFLSRYILTSVHFSGLDEPEGRPGRKVGWTCCLLHSTNFTFPWFFNTGGCAFFRFMGNASPRSPWSLCGYSHPSGEGVVV